MKRQVPANKWSEPAFVLGMPVSCEAMKKNCLIIFKKNAKKWNFSSELLLFLKPLSYYDKIYKNKVL